jgi:endoglucanase
MNDKGISWIAWSVSDKAETCSVLNPSATSNGGWKEGDIKDWGKITKEKLKKY